MIWAIASSAFIIYLYRKLDAEITPPAVSAGPADRLNAELAALDEKIATLERRLTGVAPGGLEP